MKEIKTKSLFNMTCYNCQIQINLYYNIKTDHYTISSSLIFRKIKQNRFCVKCQEKLVGRQKKYCSLCKPKLTKFQGFDKEHSIKISCIRRGINREDFNGFSRLRREKATKLNHKSDIEIENYLQFHHIMSDVGIYIPTYLHKSVKHCFKTRKNMNKINKLALDYLINGI